MTEGQQIYTPNSEGVIVVDLSTAYVRDLGGWPDREDESIVHLQGSPIGARAVLKDPESGYTCELGWYSISRAHECDSNGNAIGEEIYPTAGKIIVSIHDLAVRPLEYQFSAGRVKPRMRRRRG